MKKIICILLMSLNLVAANLLTYNVYQREDRLDVVLGFDAPFTGQIVQKPYNIPFYTLSFKGLVYDGVVDKNLSATVADAMQISSKNNETLITFASSKPLNIDAVFLGKDKFSVRIRLSLKESQAAAMPKLQNTKPSLQNNLQNDSYDSSMFRYIAVVLILCLLVFVLLILKKKISQNGGKIFQINNKNLNVKYEKYLDKNNRFMVLEYEKQSYVVIVGNTNLLLDKKGIVSSNENFEAYFEENKAKIQNMISARTSDNLSKKSALNAYQSRLDSEILK